MKFEIGLISLMVGALISGCGGGSDKAEPSQCQNPSGHYTMSLTYISGSCTDNPGSQVITATSFGDMFGDPFDSIDCPGTMNVSTNNCSATVDYTCTDSFSNTAPYHVSGTIIVDDAGFNQAHGNVSVSFVGGCSGAYSVIWTKH